MNKKWKYHAIGAVVCLAVFCMVAVRQANETADGVRVPVLADETAVIKKQSDNIAPQTEEAAIVQEQTIHKKEQPKTDTVCLPTGSVVRGFGWQEDSGAWRYHSGIDIAYRKGEQVRIIKGGTVERVERCAGGYAVEVKSGDDLWRYEPLADINIAVGSHIKAGTVISTMQEETALHIARQNNGIWITPISMQDQIRE
ncbi:MAG: M23 family metallopeptidase [Selenomonadales bacterium]|nr:M23 family metallopeptidase [Selenomonadales bacterium]